MHKIDKELAKLSKNERTMLLSTLTHIQAGNFAGLDMTKLTGSANIFRIRKGAMRIIFSISKNGISILDIGRRNEKTYRKF